MAVGFRVANSVPWDGDKGPDWGKVIDAPADAIDEVVKRARRHMGGGFRTRERGEDAFGDEFRIKKLDDHLTWRFNHGFKLGDTIIVWAQRDNAKILVRKIEVPQVEMETQGDDDVDFNHGLIFKNPKFKAVESWGIRNDRYINGTSTPSMHWARTGGSDAGCTARAEDFGGASLDLLWDVARAIRHGGRCGKVLIAGSEWMPGWDDFRFIGSHIDHYDHVHAESRDSSGSLC